VEPPEFLICAGKLFRLGFGGGERAEVIDGPIGENGAAIDITIGDRAEDARIVGADAVVAHDKVIVGGDADGAEIAEIFVLRRYVRLGDDFTVDEDGALADFDSLAGKADDALDERFGAVEGIPENDDVAALDGREAIDKLVDEDALLIGKERSHAGAFDFDGLVEEDNDDEGEADGDEQVAGPDADFVAQGMTRGEGIGARDERRAGGRASGSRRGGELFFGGAVHFLLPCIYSMPVAGRARFVLWLSGNRARMRQRRGSLK